MSIDFLDPAGSRYIKRYSCVKCNQLQAKVERLENRWISVDQRLPDTQKMVLCYMPVAYNGQIHYGWLNQDLDFRGNPSKKTWREHSHNAYAHAMEDPLFTGTDASKVTHWMPRPEPPAQEKGDA